ncbi:hypothetical protein [Brevundimonas sp.]|uniref:hypothetical protein n=1 Tax=Brevundimonas sp. TaxID=1871086 RepID=UPI002AB96BC3|nr:hypothetical protein [Brevundimonas sp.]MDZ4364009.1 hypothetical protein [Brevundimonas sp.]
MANYPSDFQAAEAAYEMVEPPVFLGVEPLLIGLFLLALLVVAALAYMQGRRAGQSTNGDDAPAAIHKALLAASQAAMSADSNALKSKAVTLLNRIEDLLGPVLIVGTGLGGSVKGLKEAIKGEVKEEAKPDPHKPSHGHDPSHGHAEPDHSVSVPAPPSGLAFNHVTVIGLSPAPAAPAPAPVHDAHAPPPATPKTRKMDADEQTQALAKAVRAFHDHWAPEPRKRIDELKAARTALSRLPSGAKGNASPALSHGGGARD